VEALYKTGHIDAAIIIDVRKFNTAMSRAPLFSMMSWFDGSNLSGVFRVSNQHQHFYFVTQETMQVMYPSPLNQSWKKKVLEIAANALAIPSTRARPSTVDPTTVLHESVSGEDDADASEQESPNKRQRVNAAAACNPTACPKVQKHINSSNQEGNS
jgi:hypothetical protein